MVMTGVHPFDKIFGFFSRRFDITHRRQGQKIYFPRASTCDDILKSELLALHVVQRVAYGCVRVNFTADWVLKDFLYDEE